MDRPAALTTTSPVPVVEPASTLRLRTRDLFPSFPEIPLERHLENLSVGQFDRGDRPRDHLYASELGYCPRAVWMGWKHPQPFDREFTETRGALGHAIEDLMAAKLARILVAREVSFRDDRVSGRVDFVVRLKRGGPQIPVEVKSTYAYTRFVKSPERSHLLQLGWYLTQMPDAPFGILIYYNLMVKGSGHWTALKIPPLPMSVYHAVRALWATVHLRSEPTCRESDPATCFSCSTHADQRGAPV